MARGRHEGGVYYDAKRKRWRGVLSLGYRANGRRRRKYFDAKTKKEALEKLKRASIRIKDEGLGPVQKPTLSEWLDTWLDRHCGGLAPATVRGYRTDCESRLKPCLGGSRIADLGTAHIQSLYDELRKKGLSARSIQRAGVTLGKALSDAQATGLIRTNPVSLVRKPRPEPTTIRVLTSEEIARLTAAAREHRLFPLLMTALDSGMRQGEIFALKWGDVDFSTRTIRVVRSLEELGGVHREKSTKNRQTRNVAISRKTADALKRLREDSLGDPVFRNDAGHWLDKSNFHANVWRKWLAAAGLEGVRFHDLRHTCASQLLRAGINIKVVSERLGHANVTTTLNIYAHSMPGMQEAAADVMDDLLG